MVVVRSARSADIETLVGLLAVLFTIEQDFVVDEEKQRQGLRMMLGCNRCCLLVAESDSGVIGMCSGQLLISTAEGGLSLLVEDVVVDSQWRGQGVGRLLMEEMSDWAMINNVSRLQLLADRNNIPALDFYHRLGWQVTGLICLRRTH
ncbi:MAG: GNAT family N-acetyltransferase [Proteobacteria bacterium]|nr:GNAT family N-acetyltransferase [Desulfobulbaceae bacterium]MBU4154175.1 GNAT family N-acetyltransferase [Pseudomonadota bacterium]